MDKLSLADIEALTARYGEAWGLPHVRRVIHIAELIAGDLTCDPLAFHIAAYLHDWGAFPPYRLPGVDHALRSAQVARDEILPRLGLTPAQVEVILEAITAHDYRTQAPVKSNEALLLREADWLDMLGVIGAVREFAWGPNDLQKCIDRILDRKTLLPLDRFSLPKAQQIASQRLKRLDRLLEDLRVESFGYF